MNDKRIIKIEGDLKDSRISENKSAGGTFLEVGGSMEGTDVEKNLHINTEKDSSSERKWWEKPFGIVILMVIAGVIVTGIVFYFGWAA